MLFISSAKLLMCLSGRRMQELTTNLFSIVFCKTEKIRLMQEQVLLEPILESEEPWTLTDLEWLSKSKSHISFTRRFDSHNCIRTLNIMNLIHNINPHMNRKKSENYRCVSHSHSSRFGSMFNVISIRRNSNHYSLLSKSPNHASNERTGMRHYCQEARKIDPVAERQFQLYYFDTLTLSKKLQMRGFTVEQSEAVAEAFVEVLQGAFDHQGKNMVTKPQQEITVQQIMAHIAALKKDMIILEKSEFSMLRSETEKQSLEIKQLKLTLKDEITKLRGNIALDINLEKGRSIEAHANNETQLQILHNKIDTEVANLRTTFEQYRNDIFKYAGGTVLTCATVCLGVIRLWS